MSISLSLFTYLKNTDLHCHSAFETLTSIMKVNYLKRMRRFGLWELVINTNSKEEAIKTVEKILDDSFYLLNPNKEGYYLDELEKIPLSESHERFFVKIEPKNTDNIKTLLDKVNVVGKNVVSIKHSYLWEITVDTLNPSGTMKNLVENEILKSTKRNAGLLLNPINETFSYLSL